MYTNPVGTNEELLNSLLFKLMLLQKKNEIEKHKLLYMQITHILFNCV